MLCFLTKSVDGVLYEISPISKWCNMVLGLGLSITGIGLTGGNKIHQRCIGPFSTRFRGGNPLISLFSGSPLADTLFTTWAVPLNSYIEVPRNLSRRRNFLSWKALKFFVGFQSSETACISYELPLPWGVCAKFLYPILTFTLLFHELIDLLSYR